MAEKYCLEQVCECGATVKQSGSVELNEVVQFNLDKCSCGGGEYKIMVVRLVGNDELVAHKE